MIVYCCNTCNLPMVERPSYLKGRCPSCWSKIYPNGYTAERIPDTMAPPSYSPAPSWEEDLK